MSSRQILAVICAKYNIIKSFFMSLKSMFENVPDWFIILNILFLLPILLWPIVAFMSIFAMDSPSSGLLGQLIFYLVLVIL